jgi:Cu2+-containing amine oxidase
VDLDIVGQENSLLHTSTTQEEVERPWLEEDWGKTVIQQKITREYITNEDDAMLKYPPNLQGGYAFVNKDAKNRWGNVRGYAIHAGLNPIHNVSIPAASFQPVLLSDPIDCCGVEKASQERTMGKARLQPIVALCHA